MARELCEITLRDNASEVFKAAQDIMLNCGRVYPFPGGDSAICRMHGPLARRVMCEIVPSPAFLRWMADNIEANLVPMDRFGQPLANEAGEAGAEEAKAPAA